MKQRSPKVNSSPVIRLFKFIILEMCVLLTTYSVSGVLNLAGSEHSFEIRVCWKSRENTIIFPILSADPSGSGRVRLELLLLFRNDSSLFVFECHVVGSVVRCFCS